MAKVNIQRRDYKGGKPSKAHNYKTLVWNSHGNAVAYSGDLKGAMYTIKDGTKYGGGYSFWKKKKGKFVRIKRVGLLK